MKGWLLSSYVIWIEKFEKTDILKSQIIDQNYIILILSAHCLIWTFMTINTLILCDIKITFNFLQCLFQFLPYYCYTTNYR